MELPRLVVAAPMSGSGKTTLAAGLIAAFTRRGLRVAPFKAGPDYIDPSYHALAAGRPCANLDSWMLPPERLLGLVARRACDAELAIVEGMMGLFDGYSGRDDAGSSAELARLLDAPILLVVNIAAMARSAAALVQGMCDFDPRLRVVGVVLNKAGSARHVQWVRDALEERGGPPVLGYLPHSQDLALPERHLGLVPTGEPDPWPDWLETTRVQVEHSLDLDYILALARDAPPCPAPGASSFTPLPHPGARHSAAQPVLRPVIAVARDAAFSFHYEENLDLLRAAGAELVWFSPLEADQLPAGAQALLLCGGFPELYAARLAANHNLHKDIRAAHQAGMPIYAECGGLMYLTEALVDLEGRSYALVGLLPGRSIMTGRLVLGYRTLQAAADGWLWCQGETLRCHEFHYSVWEGRPPDLPQHTTPARRRQAASPCRERRPKTDGRAYVKSPHPARAAAEPADRLSAAALRRSAARSFMAAYRCIGMEGAWPGRPT